MLGPARALRITLFTPQTRWVDAAAISTVSGGHVVAAVALFYAGAFVVAYRPTRREAKRDSRETEVGKWEDSN